ncbi:MAG: ATP synthase subunit C [Lachnospiraceae bacterium]|nr:ATP synthase subunit C [Lachnospiraceae bacterium]
MLLAAKITLALALILGIILPTVYFFMGEKKKGRYKRALAGNILFFFGCMIISTIFMFNASPALAEETTEAAAGVSAAGMAYFSAALAIGMSCIGGGIAVASAASAALGAISEDSSVLGKSLIFVGLAEGVCLYGLIIAFMILGKV